MLVRTPAPKSTESFLGYLLRVSEANGYDTPKYVLEHAGLTDNERRNVRFPLGKFTQILGCDMADLESISYTGADADGQRAQLLGHSLGRSLRSGPLRLKSPAFCPHCVCDNGYIDAFWDLNQVVACPIHSCKVIELCPDCGQSLHWLRPGLLTCKCGADLAKAETSAADPEVCKLMAMFKSKLHGLPILEDASNHGWPIKILNSLSLYALLGITAGLGKHNLRNL